MREDLIAETFGYLKVIRPAPDKITPSGQKRKMCECKCMLCGNIKIVSVHDLKRGAVKSCGCLRSAEVKQRRNIKVCVVCGNPFECPPSSKTVTCSIECRKIYARERQLGKHRSAETREKISSATKGRDMTRLQHAGTQAAMESQNSGRFETNVNAKDWHLISPEGKHYYFRSLSYWLRKNGLELFGCEPDSREYNNVRAGLSGAKRAMLGKKYGCCTYKGWKVIPDSQEGLHLR